MTVFDTSPAVICTWPSCKHTAKGQCRPQVDVTASIYGERDRLAAQVVQLQRDLDAAKVRAERAEVDMIGVRDQIGRLLTTIDDWDRHFADKEKGGLTMHTYGQTPDWFVEAAFWACYGFGPLDPRAALENPHD